MQTTNGVGDNYMIGRLRNWTKRWVAMLLCFTMIFCGCQPALLTSYAAGFSVKISKVDAVTGEELEGACFCILDSNRETVVGWVSGKEAFQVEGLNASEMYVLEEGVAPEGYFLAPDATFLIGEDGQIDTDDLTVEDGVLLVKDEMTHVKVSKVDAADGSVLEGATLQIIDSDDKVVDEWTSGLGPHEIFGLKTREVYTLRETVAPDGYIIAADADFIIGPKGDITCTCPATVDEDGNMILLVEDEKTHVKISRVDHAGGEVLEGAKLQIIDKDGNVVDEWTSPTLTSIHDHRKNHSLD